LKIAKLTTAPYTYTWTNIAGGIYNITAVATNSLGHIQTSNIVKITVGVPPMVRLEAENATRAGAGMVVVTDVTASNNKYVSITSADANSTITWKLTSVPAAGNYPITFGYRCPFGSKTQFINVNGVLVNTLEFTAVSPTTWYEKTIHVDLVQDTNTIQMQMSWAWMYLDYLAVPRDINPTSVKNLPVMPVSFSLEQNYPNPFNPTTTINFSLAKASDVKLTVYNILGQKVATLVDTRMKAGKQSVEFDASKLSSGVYFYRLDAGDFLSNKKMLFLK
jgi:hypothetical protein